MRTLIGGTDSNEYVKVGHILNAFGVHGFAFLLLTLSLLNTVIFMVPFLSILFGLPMIILSGQMVVGFRIPIFPRFVRQAVIKRDRLATGLEKAIKGVERIERYIKPRLSFLSNPHLDRLHGLTALVLAVMVAIPIPLFNIPPSIALILLGIGILQRDGLFIIIAYSLGFWCLILLKSLGHIAHALTLNAST